MNLCLTRARAPWPYIERELLQTSLTIIIYYLAHIILTIIITTILTIILTVILTITQLFRLVLASLPNKIKEVRDLIVFVF